jgi:hypothetical protein
MRLIMWSAAAMPPLSQRRHGRRPPYHITVSGTRPSRSLQERIVGTLWKPREGRVPETVM